MKILVTGGTGYIGSHTVVELMQDGHEVVIIDDLSNSKLEVLDRVGKIVGRKPLFYRFDLCDFDALEDFFKKVPNIDSIIHFAASKAVGESVEQPLLYYRNNLVSLMNLIEMMRTHKVHNIVFSSSCTVYGQPDQLPVDEKTPFKKAESPYGNTKQICEEILSDSTRSYKEIRAIALRYFNPVGAHESALIGEFPNGVPNNLVPFITQTAAGIRPELKIFGSDYATPDGTAIRDFIHVVDLARAHVLAVKRLVNNAGTSNYEFFNVGTGNGFSVLEAVRTFEKVNGVNVNHQLVERREGDIEKIYANTTLAKQELGWEAEYGLDEMLSSAWKWQKNLENVNC